MAEKTLNAMPAELRRRYTKGTEALTRENYDYAIDLFNQVLDTDPSFYECRKALRLAQHRKAGGGGGFFKKMLNTASASPQLTKAHVTLRSNPREALSIAEQVLNSDPNNNGAHKIVVEAAAALELPHTALYSLEVLVKNSPRDRDIVVQYGKALADIGETGRAEKVLVEFVRANPTDAEAANALKNISARRSMKEGGYDAASEGKGSYRDILKDKQEAVTLEQESRVQKSEDVAERLINEYETRLKTEPENLRLVRQLGELYTQKKQFDKALECYERIRTTEMGTDPSLERAMAETVVRRYDHQIEQLDQQSPDYTEQAEKLKAEKLAYQLAECQKRVERFPTDLSIRFEMGVLYFQAGKTGEATKEFQKAQGNPNKRIASMNYLAQCFAKRKILDLAASTLEDAIREKTLFDDEKKELIYNLGSVLETMGKKEDAIEQFKQIYKVDTSYRDVEARVDAYYAGQ